MTTSDRFSDAPKTRSNTRNNIPDRQRLLTEQQVAERQGRAVKTLQNQRVTGDGIPFVKLGRSVRYRLSDVEAWEAARVRTSTSDIGGSR